MSVQIDGAIVREQGITFAIAVVKKHVVDSAFEADRALDSFMCYFPGVPVVLAAQDGFGRFSYYGRRDITCFLSSINPARIPWRQFTFS